MSENQRVTWGYARLSVDLGQSGIENQKDDIRRYAEVRGWDLSDERLLEEVARAYRQKGQAKRPKFEKLIQTADEDPERFRLIVYNLDRLVRDLSDFVRLRDLADRGAEVHAVTGNLDLASSVGRMNAGVVVSVKGFEVEELTRRIRANKLHAKARGQYLGGSLRSFGYTDASAARKIIPEEAEILEWIVDELRIKDRSWRSITAELRDRGIKTATGVEMNPPNVSKMMLSPIIYGKMIHEIDGEMRLVDAPWEAILPMADFEFMKDLRVKRALYRGSHDVAYLCSGALTCGNCTTPKKMGSAGPRKYRCRSCNNSISKEIDQLVEKMVLLRLRDWSPDPEMIGRLDLNAENTRLDELKALLDSGVLSRSMFEVGVTEVETAIARKTEAHERSERRVPEWMGSGESILGLWDTLTMREKRDVVATVLKSVTILPFDRSGFGRFQSDRVQIAY